MFFILCKISLGQSEGLDDMSGHIVALHLVVLDPGTSEALNRWKSLAPGEDDCLE